MENNERMEELLEERKKWVAQRNDASQKNNFHLRDAAEDMVTAVTNEINNLSGASRV